MIPTSIAERWRPMWRPDAHPERPWWRQDHLVWRRCDGAYPADYTAIERLRAAPEWYWNGVESYSDFIARIDREHPLPAPPPLPGQTWAWSETEMATVVDIRNGRPIWNGGVPPEPVQLAAREHARLRIQGPPVPPRETVGGLVIGSTAWVSPSAEDYVWPPPGAILVAGPSPWGRDVPWMDTREGR